MPPESDTRTAILDAGERLFAERGYAATTIKHIGTEAGVNSALLYYYFADKERLYREVLHRLLDTLMSEGERVFASAPSPEEAIRGLVRVQGDLMASRPHVPRLIARELVDHNAAHVTGQFAQLAAGVFKQLCEMIREGQRDGRFDPSHDPQFAAISTIAQVVYFHIARPAVGILLGHGTDGPPAHTARAYAAHAADFALAALSVQPVKASAKRKRP
jgi:AcrR family transcriptional regulator